MEAEMGMLTAQWLPAAGVREWGYQAASWTARAQFLRAYRNLGIKKSPVLLFYPELWMPMIAKALAFVTNEVKTGFLQVFFGLMPASVYKFLEKRSFFSGGMMPSDATR